MAATAPESQTRPAPGPAPDPVSFIRVRTTVPRRPLPPNAVRQPIYTERLVLRTLTMDDLPDVRILRTQPEVMHWTAAGVPDGDLEQTRSRLMPFLPPGDGVTYNFGIYDRATGEFVGMGGSHQFRSSLGWPEIGYMIKKEYWGKGLGTELVKGWLGAWEALEREEVELEVDARTIDEEEKAAVAASGGLVRERLIAITATGNDKSQGVLQKAGFEWFLTWLALDSVKGSGPESLIELPSFRYFTQGKKSE
ncbi:GNAT domain-containing protein [Dichotomopilus funicola]|uniref:GNAT domain-containing protein n=1 Tax=Dichotomopilus funicola TaxID=1934379 RepID=A0AAN6ZSZ0_9PEZI|nr:GNAT domain-containing protein [Dichotomopilus funicola]